MQFLLIGSISFGGGSTIISMIKDRICNKLHWMEEEEILNYIAIAQGAPGATTINISILIGYSIFKLPGVLLCALATAIPPFFSIVLVYFAVENLSNVQVAANMIRAVRVGSAALVASVVINMMIRLIQKKNIFLIGLMAAFLLVNLVLKVDVIILILSCIPITIIYSFFSVQRKKTP